jgi:hypothetical protein
MAKVRSLNEIPKCIGPFSPNNNGNYNGKPLNNIFELSNFNTILSPTNISTPSSNDDLTIVPLKKLFVLASLDLSHNKIVNIEPLRYLQYFEILDLSHNQIIIISILV